MRVEPCDSKFCARADQCAILAVQEIGWCAEEVPKAKTYRKERRYCVLHRQQCGRKACNAQDMCEDTLINQEELEEPEEDDDEEISDDDLAAWHVNPDGEPLESREDAINALITILGVRRAAAEAMSDQDIKNLIDAMSDPQDEDDM